MKATLTLLLLAAILVTPAILFADTVAPTLDITAPEPGITVTSASVDITVQYAAPEGLKVTRVALLVDGVKLEALDFDPPQVNGQTGFAWDTTQYHDGQHEIVARAVDSKGHVAAKTITVLLQRALPDLGVALRITHPKSGQTVSGVSEIGLEGDPQEAVKYVIFLVDNVFKAMTNVRPFSYRWDTTRYLNGLHNLQARAYLHDGTDCLTPAVEVRVDNPSGATTLKQPDAQPAAPVSPAPTIATPARTDSASLPPPMHTESPSQEPRLVEVAEPEVARPGTAPFVSPSGDLIQPPSMQAADRSAAAAPVEIASLPTELAQQQTQPTPAGTMVDAPAPVEMVPPPVPQAETPSTAPTPLEPVTSEPAPVDTAALPSPITQSVPALPAPESVTAPMTRAALVTRRAAGQTRSPATTGIEVAMLPPLPQAQPPAPKVIAQPTPQTTVYVVREGDCLWDIAEKHGVAPRALAMANSLANPSVIHPGQQLRVPSVELYANGSPLATDTPITISNGRVIAPFRTVVEGLGGTVSWDSTTRRAMGVALGRDIAVTIGSDLATVDDTAVAMGGPAELHNNRTVVPLRFLGDALTLNLTFEAGAVHIATAR